MLRNLHGKGLSANNFPIRVRSKSGSHGSEFETVFEAGGSTFQSAKKKRASLPVSCYCWQAGCFPDLRIDFEKRLIGYQRFSRPNEIPWAR